MYAYWVYVPRKRPPFSARNFCSGAYHFHKFPPNPFRSITILLFVADFAVPETIIFFNPFRSITILHFLEDFAVRETVIFRKRSAAPRVSNRPERQRQTRPGNSGE